MDININIKNKKIKGVIIIMKKEINVVYLNEKCVLRKGSTGAIAYDVIANISEPLVVKKNTFESIPLGFKVDMKEPSIGMFLYIRSGLAFKHGLMLINSVGVIDSDYRGEVALGIYNTGTVDDYTVMPYERIGQVIFMSSPDFELNEVKVLNETERGEGGFGHTGRVFED